MNSEILNLPLPDSELLDYIKTSFRTFNRVSSWPQLDFDIYDADQKVTDWVNKHISDKWMSIRVFYIGKYLPIHIDINRDIVLNFVIQSGNGHTSFYEFHDPSLYNIYKFSQKIISPDIVSLLETVVIPENTWYKINCGIPHGVTELEMPRILLTVAFKKEFSLINCY